MPLHDRIAPFLDPRQEQNRLLNVGSQLQQVRDLRHPHPSDVPHSGDLLRAIFRSYDKFSDELQAELPLKRVWSLVMEE